MPSCRILIHHLSCFFFVFIFPLFIYVYILLIYVHTVSYIVRLHSLYGFMVKGPEYGSGLNSDHPHFLEAMSIKYNKSHGIS